MNFKGGYLVQILKIPAVCGLDSETKSFCFTNSSKSIM